MKTFAFVVVLLAPAALAQSTAPVVLETGPHHRVHVLAEEEGGPARRVVELGTGMHYWDGEQWQASAAVIEEREEGFVAERLQYQVRLGHNLNGEGSVRVMTPDGEVLDSAPVAIGLYDPAGGELAIIGAIADSAGEQVEEGTVVYANAFSGVCADVVYRVEAGSFAQYVVFTGWLDPAAHGFDRETVQVQVFSEFYGARRPERIRRPLRVEERAEVRRAMVSPDLVDELLDFGDAQARGLWQPGLVGVLHFTDAAAFAVSALSGGGAV